MVKSFLYTKVSFSVQGAVDNLGCLVPVKHCQGIILLPVESGSTTTIIFWCLSHFQLKNQRTQIFRQTIFEKVSVQVADKVYKEYDQKTEGSL